MSGHSVETARLRLVPPEGRHFEDFASLMAHPDVMRYLGDGQPVTGRVAAWRAFAAQVGHWQLRGYGFWIVEDRATGEFLGRLGCWYPEGWPGFEVGWILHPRAWGRGIATEGATAAVRHAFTTLDQPRVLSVIHPDNAPSTRVAERIGERYSHDEEVEGKTRRIYVLERSEWRDWSEIANCEVAPRQST
jgi:RimJ/RimL family protein N-acetyltransferase